MKKLYTTLTLLSVLGLGASAQNQNAPTLEKQVNKAKSASQAAIAAPARSNYVTTINESTERGGIACGFEVDFESGFPAGWTNVSNNPNENWELLATGGNPDGNMTCLFDNVTNQNESILTGLIDLTTIPNPTLKFDWLMSYHWAVTVDNYDVSVSISTDGIIWNELWTEADYGEFETYEWYTTNVDLSAYSSLSAAFLRFNYSGFDGAQASLDNISVCTAQNDLRVNTVLMGDIVNDYAYSQIPVSQASEVITGVIFSNAGATTLTNVSLDGELYSFVANANVSTGTIAGPTSLAPGESDTVWVATGYVPSMIDTLVQTFVATTDQVDAFPVDNEGAEVLLLTADTWAHDYELEDYYAFGYTSADAIASSGFEMGATYYCQTSGGTIYAVDFPLGSATTAQSITIRVYEINLSGNTLISSTLYDILPGDLSTTAVNFINVPLHVPVAMGAGNVYRATVAIEGGDDAYILGNNIDDGDGGQVLYSDADDAWYNWTGLTTAMRLRVSSVVGVEENDGLSSLQVYPNPTSDNINVNFVSETDDLVTINVIAADGKLVHSTTQNVTMGQSTTAVIDAANLASGIYSVQLLGERVSSIQRVVVQ